MLRPRSLLIRLIPALVVVGLFATANPSTADIVFAGSDPCEAVQGDPPIDDPDPEIGGTVTNAGSNSGVHGATVQLFRCDSGTSVFVDDTTTGAYGGYAFSSLETPKYYYVKVLLTGPLAGFVPSSGTTNPSAVLSVGSSHYGIDFAFEEE